MKIILMMLTVLCLLSPFALAQADKNIPSAEVKKLDGGKINTSTFSNDSKPMLIVFWATWCKPCKMQLDAIAENYADWQRETGVKLIAISIDDARTSAKVAPEVKAKGWEFEVYIDENGAFKNAIGASNAPYTFLINGKGEVVWSYNSYNNGDEDLILANVKKVKNGEKPTN